MPNTLILEVYSSTPAPHSPLHDKISLRSPSNPKHIRDKFYGAQEIDCYAHPNSDRQCHVGFICSISKLLAYTSLGVIAEFLETTPSLSEQIVLETR